MLQSSRVSLQAVLEAANAEISGGNAREIGQSLLGVVGVDDAVLLANPAARALGVVRGTRLLVPFRMTIPTPLGQAMLEATSFVTTAAPPRVAKTQ